MIDRETEDTSFEIGTLYRKARSGKITLDTFFDELDSVDVTSVTQTKHAAQAFGMSLAEAKKAYVERHPDTAVDWKSEFASIAADNNWFECWYIDGIETLPTNILVVTPAKDGDEGIIVIDWGKNKEIVFRARTYEEASFWLSEDEYEPIQGRIFTDQGWSGKR